MKKLFTATALIFFALLVSCDNESGKKEQAIEPSVLPATANPFSASTDSLATRLTLNPKHGEPGHRCDVAEGAPLNTPVINNSIPPTIAPATTPVNVESKNLTPNTNSSSLNLNPKHGEPGHRCDIAVGAPLSSKPGQ